jgi:hypothetical protein
MGRGEESTQQKSTALVSICLSLLLTSAASLRRLSAIAAKSGVFIARLSTMGDDGALHLA